ncbi:reticulon-like protein B11 [Andrographis paniculata]|uniref:reticulon-like protein B11 n=1 Tax=Andrographis paniculata TaxID=175694 RepID=UPI0021E889FB|nr:reticulon-like protein B11 [Andrographis paniculata]
MGDSDSSRRSVHHALGGGAVADILLWKKWYPSAALLVGSTALWFLLEVAGYNLLSFISNVLLLLVVILFCWAKSASLLNRPLPPLPNLELSEATVAKAADEMRVQVNYALSVAHDIAIGGNLKLFTQVTIGLWVVSYVGSFFNFISLVYFCTLLSLSVPVLYDRYQKTIDEKLGFVCNIAAEQCHKIDNKILQKIPLFSNDKKIQ